MPTASNTIEGDILFAGDLDPTSTGLIPYLRASGVTAGSYNYSAAGVDGSGNSIINIPQAVVDSKGRVIFAKVIPYTITSSIATTTNFGIVKPDNTTITVTNGVIQSSITAATATNSVFGKFRPDNTTITVVSGVMTRVTPIATSSVKGFVKPNNTTVFVDSGTINVREAYVGQPGIFRPDGVTTKINDATQVVSLQESTSTKKGIHSVNSTLSLNAGVMSVPDATSTTLGKVKVDGTTISIDGNGVLSAAVIYATNSTVGVAKANETNLTVGAGGELSLKKATGVHQGIVKADETTLNIVDGVISRNTATSSVLGQVRPDNTTLVSSSGVLSASLATGFSLGVSRPDNVTLTSAGGVLTVPVTSNTILGRATTDNSSVTISSGVISIPTATSTTLGVVRPDASMTVSSGVLSVPTASTTVAGSVKVDGTGIVISGGTISKVGTLPIATATEFGAVKFNSSFFDVFTYGQKVKVCSDTTLGMIRVGSGLTVSSDGTLSVPAARLDRPNTFSKSQFVTAMTAVAGSAGIGAVFGDVTSSFGDLTEMTGHYIHITNTSTSGLIRGFESGSCIGAQFILRLRNTSINNVGFTFPSVSADYFGGFKVEGGSIPITPSSQSVYTEMVVINKGGQPFGLIYNQNIF